MDRQTFLARSETFGFDTDDVWGLPALRLVTAAPRAYAPLVEAWEARHPGTRKSLDRLVERGFVAYQPPVVFDTTTSKVAERSSRKVPRYRTTNRGHELVKAASEDIRVLEERFPRTAKSNTAHLLEFLRAFDLEDSHVRFGLSTRHANLRREPGPAGERTWLAERTAKWWVTRLVADRYLKPLEDRFADVREVVPEHWRVKRSLTRQIEDVVSAFVPSEAEALKIELKVTRSRYLSDIDPARVGISGATDFDHDVTCQRILASMFRSPQSVTDGIFAIEPKWLLPLDRSTSPAALAEHGDGIWYQPDAALRERSPDGQVRLAVVEYERYQSRRDAWSHIEKFLAYLKRNALPFEPAVLRFVVDSQRRESTYVQLIEAFADYALDHPERIPSNPVTLAVSSVPRVTSAADPLHESTWFRVLLPTPARSDTACVPVLHDTDRSPYNDYFARTSRG